MFRISPVDLEVAAFVLSNTAESSEGTMVLQQVEEIFLHEGFEATSLNNDIAILKVGIFLAQNANILHYLVRKHTFDEVYWIYKNSN
jgi:hypothetical protein